VARLEGNALEWEGGGRMATRTTGLCPYPRDMHRSFLFGVYLYDVISILFIPTALSTCNFGYLPSRFVYIVDPQSDRRKEKCTSRFMFDLYIGACPPLKGSIKLISGPCTCRHYKFYLSKRGELTTKKGLLDEYTFKFTKFFPQKSL